MSYLAHKTAIPVTILTGGRGLCEVNVWVWGGMILFPTIYPVCDKLHKTVYRVMVD